MAADPTAATKAAIEQYYGAKLSDASPELLAHVVDCSRQAGNKAFAEKNYQVRAGEMKRAIQN